MRILRTSFLSAQLAYDNAGDPRDELPEPPEVTDAHRAMARKSLLTIYFEDDITHKMIEDKAREFAEDGE